MVNSDFPYAVASGYFPPRSVDHRKELFAAATGRCWEESRAEAWRASQYGGRDAGVVWALFVGNFPTNTTPSVDMLDIVQAYQQDKPAVTTMRPSVWQAAHDVLRKCTAPTDPPVRSILDSIVHGRLFTTHYSSNQVVCFLYALHSMHEMHHHSLPPLSATPAAPPCICRFTHTTPRTQKTTANGCHVQQDALFR